MLLDDLWNDLTVELSRDSKGPRVAEMLGTYARQGTDWRDFALFGSEGYARNLLGATEHFELLLLCWNPHQASPIHNHEGQRCWMTTLEGEIEETHFRCCPDGEGPLLAGSPRTFQTGQVAFISDDIALHRISPKNGGHGISMHLYSKPIRECSVYCATTGRVERRRLAYHSVRGVLQPGS